MTTTLPIVRRSARAVLIDDEDRLVVIRRARPGQEPYWTTAGGGVESEDTSRAAAVERELGEELGAVVRVGQQVFLVSSVNGAGLTVQHFFLCRLLGIEPALRVGPEHTDLSRGAYELDRIPLKALAGFDLRPTELRDFVIANHQALLADVPAA